MDMKPVGYRWYEAKWGEHSYVCEKEHALTYRDPEPIYSQEQMQYMVEKIKLVAEAYTLLDDPYSGVDESIISIRLAKELMKKVLTD